MSVEKDKKELIHTKIWKETSEPDNPFATKISLCAGYDVYGDLLGNASWVEYLYLLFKLEKPTKDQAELFESIAVSIANPGIRDHSVRAAMNAGVGGSTSASALMAALAVGAGQLGGAREVYLCMQSWNKCHRDINKWKHRIKNPPKEGRADVWTSIEHSPGFDPNGVSCSTPVKQVLANLSEIAGQNSNLSWLIENRQVLETFTNSPLTMTGVIATAFSDLGLTEEQGEMLFLLLRLPGAAVHALEQRKHGWKKYPFFVNGITLTNDPGPVDS